MSCFFGVYSVTSILMISVAVMAGNGGGDCRNECHAFVYFVQEFVQQAWRRYWNIQKKVKHRFTSRVEGVKEIQEADKEELLFLQLMITLAFCTFLYCCVVYNFSVW